MLLQNKKRFIWIIACVAATISLAFICSRALGVWPAHSAPSPEARLPKPQAKESVEPAKAPASQPPQAPAPYPVKGEGNPGDQIPVAGNLAKITSLQATLEETKLQAAIVQEQEKLRPKTPTPQPQLSLPLPEVPKPSPVKAKAPSPMVVSVQGINGTASATIRAGSGALVTVRVGDHFNGGIVSNVNRDGVSVKRGNSSTILPFE